MGFDKKDILILLLGEQSATNSKADFSDIDGQQAKALNQEHGSGRPKSHQEGIS